MKYAWNCPVSAPPKKLKWRKFLYRYSLLSLLFGLGFALFSGMLFQVIAFIFGIGLSNDASAMPPPGVNGQGITVVYNYNQGLKQQQYEADLKELAALGYQEFNPETSPETYRAIQFLIKDFTLENHQLPEFLKALETEKSNLMEYYELDNALYNQLAIMAIGILGNESKFFDSPMYAVKANVPDFLLFAFKDLVNGDNEASTLSKGPTLMKAIPEKIARYYGLNDKEQLEVPFNAAVATLGYLAEINQELEYKVDHYNMTCVNEKNYFDMLLYLYFGGPKYRKELINCEVNPDINIYVKNHRENRKKVLLFEAR